MEKFINGGTEKFPIKKKSALPIGEGQILFIDYQNVLSCEGVFYLFGAR